MDVPVTPKREEISELFQKGQYAELQNKFGIKLIGEAGTLSCDGYVLNSLNIVANEQTIKALLEAPRLKDPARGIILYSFKERKGIKHYGVFDDGMVTSKWERGNPVFRHRIEDIPAQYGDFVEFVLYTPELIANLHAAERAPKRTEEEY